MVLQINAFDIYSVLWPGNPLSAVGLATLCQAVPGPP